MTGLSHPDLSALPGRIRGILLVWALCSAAILPGFTKTDPTPVWPGEFHFCGTNAAATVRLTFRFATKSATAMETAVRTVRLELPARILFKHEESGRIFLFGLSEIASMDVSYRSFYFGWAGKGVGDSQERTREFAVHMGYKARQLDILRLRLKDGTELEGDRASGLNYLLFTDPGVKLYGDEFWLQMKDLQEAVHWNVKETVNWVNTWPLFPWAARFLKACEFNRESRYAETKISAADLVRIDLSGVR